MCVLELEREREGEREREIETGEKEQVKFGGTEICMDCKEKLFILNTRRHWKNKVG